MKKITLILFSFGIFASMKAQDSATLRKHYLKVYTQALGYNDVNVAINALQGYLAVDNSLIFKDTLSMLYFSTKNYYSALLLSEEVYKAEPNNLDAMARTAECYDELGDPKTAISLFEQVVPKTKSPYQAYKLAVCQYQLKRTSEAENSAKFVLADTNSKKIGVPFTSMNGNQQAVSVAAAAANLIGVLRMDAKNYADAKKYFDQALTLFPEFVGAKENLEAVNRASNPTKTPAKTPAKRG
ncbi:MAG TPA: CDC27 family protein [Chitinophagaceae bacterium]|nr:CDC27 family protein [Chitinophagaceae bacterium]